MKGDFSRVTFDPAKQYTRVLLQQGRVQLDADWNEQADIFQHSLRTLAADLIGPFGAPPEADGTAGQGFKLVPHRSFEHAVVELLLLPGRYYVDGVVAANLQESKLPGPFAKSTLFYLDVWERHITYLEDELLREVALLGPDTATRSKVVWRVRTATATPDGGEIPADLTCRSLRRKWRRWVEHWQPPQRGRLKARARPGTPDDTDPCLASPEARYRGENQLYRVEIHAGGAAGPNGTATFKWSADNGSVVFPIRELAADPASQQTTATLEHLGRGDGAGLVQDDWVEVVDGTEDLRQGADPLLQVASVDADRLRVVLKGEPPAGLTPPLILRRWDHRRGIARKKLRSTGVYPVLEDEWLDLEDGVQILFDKPQESAAHAYRAGDYWLIPARVATGDVEWPGPADQPEPRPPHGVEHHYAPLGLLALVEQKGAIQDCRTTFGARSVALSTGVADWQLTKTPTGFAPAAPPIRPADVVANPDSVWQLLPGAQWISASVRRGMTHPGASPGTSSGTYTAGDYTFELRFDLCSRVDHAELWLDLLADNLAKIFLNNVQIGEQKDPRGFERSKPPTQVVKSGKNPATDQPWFLAGENVLRVEVHNDQGPAGFILRGAVDLDECSCR